MRYCKPLYGSQRTKSIICYFKSFVDISHYGYSKDIYVKTKALSSYKYISIPLKTIQTYGVGYLVFL